MSSIKHISVRVPWRDNGWNGYVCNNPATNLECTCLKGILLNKDVHHESENSSKLIVDLCKDERPPCLNEHGTFLYNNTINIEKEHPYVKTNEKYKHFKPTNFTLFTNSVAPTPFRSMLRKTYENDKYNKENETLKEFLGMIEEPDIGFQTGWLQHEHNQRAALNFFWNKVKQEQSLVIFYAKQIPNVNDSRRIIVAIGKINKIAPILDYEYDESLINGKSVKSVIWERPVSHSIKFDNKVKKYVDGIVMPYHEAMDKYDTEDFDFEDIVAFAPSDNWLEFSYGTEHVSSDSAVSALLSCRDALESCRKHLQYNCKEELDWIDNELGLIWKERGAFPGFPAILAAKDLSLGHIIGNNVQDMAVKEQISPWDMWSKVLDDLSLLDKRLSKNISKATVDIWKKYAEELQYMSLISRLSLTKEQAKNLLSLSVEQKKLILNNPYLTYEFTRLLLNPISFNMVDKAYYKITDYVKEFPLNENIQIKDDNDERRVRALIINILEQEALAGNSLTFKSIVLDKSELISESLTNAENYFGDEIVIHGEGEKLYQLRRFDDVRKIIANKVEERLKKTYEQTFNWEGAYDLHDFSGSQDKESQKNARQKADIPKVKQERIAALKEMESNALTVLIGGAGTGKTSLVSLMCKHPEVNKGHILLLAPTGKASVRLKSKFADKNELVQVDTVAGFLMKRDCYHADTSRYILNHSAEKEKGYSTVVIDECSMLTEEMLATLLQILVCRRLILIGDPRQLPPIGAGRPFVDIISKLTKDQKYKLDEPIVSKSYVKLQYTMRQSDKNLRDRNDVIVAKWFDGESQFDIEDIIDILNKKDEHIFCEKWNDDPELINILQKYMKHEFINTLGCDRKLDDELLFAQSIGAEINVPYANFKNTYTKDGKLHKGAVSKVDDWQILCATKIGMVGARSLNDIIHKKYRGKAIEYARKNPFPYKRTVPKPFGDELIIRGDKVISIQNKTYYEKRLYPKQSEMYIANGDMGITCMGGINKTNCLEAEFAEHKGTLVSYFNSDFPDGSGPLELAYALTVHKAQGSEFNVVFIVIPKKARVSRELLYTAFTRQVDKVIILHQQEQADLLRYARADNSETVKRITYLFELPILYMMKGVKGYYEERLIHKTAKGDLVRSKSEVIIADALHDANVEYIYEEPITRDGVTRLPDFTVVDDFGDIICYWEHLGMLHVEQYRQSWEKKLAWYNSQGISEENGMLIITRDDDFGAINSEEMRNIIKKRFI